MIMYANRTTEAFRTTVKQSKFKINYLIKFFQNLIFKNDLIE